MKTSGVLSLLDQPTLKSAAKTLARRDPALATVYRRLGPPPLWKRPAAFSTLVRIVIEQQVSLAAAKAVYERLRAACGGNITPSSVSLLDDDTLRGAGLSRQKARYIRDFSVAVGERGFSVRGLQRLSDADATRQIQSLLGFGTWSADIYMMMALMRPDLLPIGDLGLVKGMAEVCEQDFGSIDEIIERAEQWRPWRSVATRMIWHVYLANRGKDAHAIALG